MDADADTHCTIQRYLKLIQRRSSGELLTTAGWLRKEVLTHPEYQYVFNYFIFNNDFLKPIFSNSNFILLSFRKDSRISQKINYDLLKKINNIELNKISCPELLGPCTTSKTTETIPIAMEKAESCPNPD